jgi:hypothetical protein
MESSASINLLRNPPKYPIKYLVRQIHGFVYCVACRDYPEINLPFPRQSQTRNDARPKVDKGSIWLRQSCVWVEHLSVTPT